MVFPRQEYWSWLPYPTPGDLPNPGIEPKSIASPALSGRVFTLQLPGKPQDDLYLHGNLSHSLEGQVSTLRVSREG